MTSWARTAGRPISPLTRAGTTRARVAQQADQSQGDGRVHRMLARGLAPRDESEHHEDGAEECWYERRRAAHASRAEVTGKAQHNGDKYATVRVVEEGMVESTSTCRRGVRVESQGESRSRRYGGMHLQLPRQSRFCVEASADGEPAMLLKDTLAEKHRRCGCEHRGNQPIHPPARLVLGKSGTAGSAGPASARRTPSKRRRDDASHLMCIANRTVRPMVREWRLINRCKSVARNPLCALTDPPEGLLARPAHPQELERNAEANNAQVHDTRYEVVRGA